MNKYQHLAFGLLTFFCLLSFGSQAQYYSVMGKGGMGTTFATDFHAIGINPANLGFRKSFRDPKLVIGAMEGGISVLAEALNRNQLFNTIFNPTKYNFSYEEKQAVANNFANKNFNADISFMWLGVSYSNDKLGGFAFSIRDRILFSALFNQTASEIAFMGFNAPYFPTILLSNGREIDKNKNPNLTSDQREQAYRGTFRNIEDAKNYSAILDGSRFSMSWVREYNLSYGKKIVDLYNFSMHIGAGVRYMQGKGVIDLAAQGGQLTSSIISLSPTFGLDFGTDPKVVQSPSFKPANPDASFFQKFAFAESVGGGFGFDLGINMVIKRNLYIGAALNNIGNITWDGNVYDLTDGKLVDLEGTGFNTYNILTNAENALQFAGDLSPFKWQGVEAKVRPLPSTFRFGASYEYFRTFHLGFDVIMPLNDVSGNLKNPLFIVGGDWQINRLIKVSSGLNYGGNSGRHVNVPAGITFSNKRRSLEVGLATLDFQSLVLSLGKSSTISLAAGVKIKIAKLPFGLK